MMIYCKRNILTFLKICKFTLWQRVWLGSGQSGLSTKYKPTVEVSLTQIHWPAALQLTTSINLSNLYKTQKSVKQQFTEYVPPHSKTFLARIWAQTELCHPAHMLCAIMAPRWSTPVCQIWATSKPYQYHMSTKGGPNLFCAIWGIFTVYHKGHFGFPSRWHLA